MARVARIALDLTLATTKSLKPAVGIAWQYLKQESAPPMTENFLNGPKAKEIEDSISKKVDDFVKVIEHRIKEAEDIKKKQKEKNDLQLHNMDKTKNKDLNVKANEKHVVKTETNVRTVNKIDGKEVQVEAVFKQANNDVKGVNKSENQNLKSVESSDVVVKDKETKPRNG